jgi:hypothetical protein
LCDRLASNIIGCNDTLARYFNALESRSATSFAGFAE